MTVVGSSAGVNETQVKQKATAKLGAAKPSISVIGLGYVGAVSMACLSHLGFRMVGVDVSFDKVRAIKEGRSPIVEARLEELLEAGVESRRIDATART